MAGMVVKSRSTIAFVILSMLAGIGTAVAASAAGYQTMAPTGQWYGRAFCGLPRTSRKLALTYDDGPNDPHTLRLLEVLAKYDVRATFFLIGRFVRMRPDIVRDLIKAGHQIGNHTQTHPLLIFQPAARVRRELEECQAAISDATGSPAKLFRPPFGGRRPAVMRIVREMGMEPVMWNVTGYDWNAKSADDIESKVTRRVRGGNVILLHDGGHLEMGADRSRTVEATKRLIAKYRAEGYLFATIPEMRSTLRELAPASGQPTSDSE
jgi:peptidoglycan/xylan/chitin deacetylase (PgdA/CDA1 family)